MNQLEMFKNDIFVSVTTIPNQIISNFHQHSSSAGITPAEMETNKTIKTFI
jgi:hypothetical protein